MAKIELGSTVRDKITGLEGVVMGRTEYLTGCAHVGIQRKLKESDSLIPDWQWVDERRVSVVSGTEVISYDCDDDVLGGPAPSAPQM